MATSLRSVAVVLMAAIAAPAALLAADAKRNVEIPVAALTHPGPVDFEKEILPIFSTSCLACHNKAKPKAGLILETPADIRKGGDDGLVVKPGKGAESLLVKAAAHTPDVDAPMPPPNNKVAAPDLTSDQLGLIKLWIDQGATGEVRGTLAPVNWRAMPAALEPIYAVSVSPDGRFAACGRANRIDLYDLSAGKLAAQLIDPTLTSAGPASAHRDMVESLAFNPEGTTLASGSYREVKLWKRSSDGEKIALGDKPAACAAISADGKLIATGGEDGVIRLWDAQTFKPAAELPGESSIGNLQFSADGARLLGISKDKTIRVWDVQSRKSFCKVQPDSQTRSAIWLSNKSIAAGDSDGALTIYRLPDAADGEMTAAKPQKDKDAGGAVVAMAAIPADDAHLLLAREDGGVYRLSIASSSFKLVLKHGSPLTAMSLRADAKRLVTAGTDNVARIWTIEDGKMIAELKGDPILAGRARNAERALTLAKNEVGYRKTKIEAGEKQVKESAERIQRAKDALPAADKAMSDAQKIFDDAKSTADAAEKAVKDKKDAIAKDFAKADDDLKKAKDAKTAASDQLQKKKDASATADREVSSAKKALDAAKSAKDAADGKSDEKKQAAADELAKADEKLKKAKDAQSSAADELKSATDAAAMADKSLAAAQKTFDAAKSAKDAAENAKDDKRDAAVKDLAKADDDLKKAKNAKSAADDEIKLSTRAAEDYGVTLATAKTAADAAAEKLKLREKDADEMKKVIGDSARPIRSVAFSPNGALIATTGDDGAVHTWSAEKGTAGEVYGHETSAVTVVAFTSADRVVICPNAAPPAILSPSSTWKLSRTIGGSDATLPFADRVTSLDFSPDDRMLVTGGGVPSRAGEIRLFDVETGTLKQSFDDVHSDTVFCVRFSPDGSRLASAGADRFVRILDLGTGKVVRSLEGHAGHALSVAWSHDAHTLASGGADNTLRFWDAETGERGKVVNGFDKEVTSVTYVGDENQAVATSGEGKVRLVRADGGEVRSYSGPTDFMYSVSTTPDGATVIAGGQDGVLRVWNGANGTPAGTFAVAEEKSGTSR